MSTEFIDFTGFIIFAYLAAGVFTFGWMVYIAWKMGDILKALKAQNR